MIQTDYRETEASLPAPVDATDNIRAAVRLGLPEFVPALLPHDGHAVVCGSGPSLPLCLDELRVEREMRRPIVAVKGAHDLLCKNGIEPDAFVSCEAKPRLENVQYANDKTIYYLSSRCSPELFDYLKGRKVVVWHPYSDKDQSLPELMGKTLIGGGTTSGLRAVTLLSLLGFAKFVLYGFDSCIDLKTKKKRYDSGAMKPEQLVDRIIRGRRFLCNGAMSMQADEAQMYYKLFPDISFDVKGDGLIAAIMKERKRLGMRV